MIENNDFASGIRTFQGKNKIERLKGFRRGVGTFS